nr:MAG TPA: Putative ATP dependent Clp protease [Caudoviricetes sp.]
MTFTLYEDIGLAPEIARHAWDIPEGEGVDIRINSCGGSVFGGMAIVAAINTLRWHGHKTRAIVEGLAASMASVVACACDEIVMHEGSMLMIHNPWTFIEGDAEELKKQAELMTKIKRDMLAVYKRKFDLPTDEISRLMDEETWIGTDELEKYKLDATVIEGTAKIAASVTKERYYSKLKERAAMTKAEKKEDKDEKTEQKTDEQPAEQKPAEEKPAEEKPAEDKPADDKDKTEDEDNEEDTLETLRERVTELEHENEELRKQLDAPVEDRVRGMQSKMQSRINAAQKEFETQLRAKTEELATAQAKATSLQSELEKTKGELQTTASALAEKTTALETLHSGVLTPHAATPTPKTRDEARRALAKLPMSARAEYYKQHRDLIDG